MQVLDLHADGFEPVLVVNEEHRRRDLDKVEATRAYREQLAWCDAMIFVYPVWWGGFPAMLKGYVDRTFVSGRARGGVASADAARSWTSDQGATHRGCRHGPA